ncbi:MAG: indolepyruvate oxidoreductase subunit beta [Spirochaetaceae bacterium]|jgi:indolepyruvate ferredoxin oxidoreductase beta subunit|nr:indolepyruvate oxidoreductase subunit beta [Spirochaetaceae bacterium]
MKTDMILAGVGGQGVLSIAAVIAAAAVKAGFRARQSEVHGMAQRGGAVLSHLRISDGAIHCDLVPRGGAALVISMEPLEGLRYTDWLSPDGALVSASAPVLNIGDYPPLADVHGAVRALPGSRLIDAEALAKDAGLPRAVNMVMVGAASPFLPVEPGVLEEAIAELFAKREPGLNVEAFRAGRKRSEALVA